VAEPAGPLSGAVLELTVGAPAHGGSCVARHEGRVVFVRHALPGERVRARVTEDRGGGFCRADAVEILTASPERVEPPCPYAGPGRCGGCDWQHATGAAQRAVKAEVVREQFARIAKLDVSELLAAGVEELPGGLLGWRTRVTYAVDQDGRPGLHRHRSGEIEHIDRCLIGAAGVGDAAQLRQRWPGLTGLELDRGQDGALTVLGHRPAPGRQPRGRRPPDRVSVLAGPARLRRELAGRAFEVSAGGFWQVHPAAADVLAAALLDAVRPLPGERVLDLYAGAGAFTALLAAAVGPTGAVVGLDAAATAVADATVNLGELPWAVVRRARVTARSVAEALNRPDLVVLDPPRAGAGRDVVRALLDLRPRAVGYVSCDPATLARDVAVATDSGWRLTALRAFDAFPMTGHVECVAALNPDTGSSAP
jgi:tRNA/tmRNA/rRNA uracil-C5-methylase (TrmA/RlmC/RlmD family)